MIGTALLLLLLWLAYLTGKPAVRPLLTEKDRRELDAAAPAGKGGNSVETFTEYGPMTEALICDLQQAQNHIHFQFFKFEEGASGRRIASILGSKAAQGVEVRVLYDHFGNLGRKAFYKEMERAGVQIRPFGIIRPPLLKKRDNYRNHRKVVVIDGRVGYMGGMNIADRYGEGLSWGNWRDTHLRIAGPAAAQLQSSFLSDWCYATGEMPALDSLFPKIEETGTVPLRILTSGPLGPGPVIEEAFCKMLDDSRRYVFLESPYLIPTRPVRDALCRAAGRGVDVRIIVPYRGDRGVLTPLATRGNVQSLLEAGVKVAFYRKGYMHAKILVSDNRACTVGSTNIDPRSFRLDLEINAFTQDPGYSQSMKEIFLKDERDSVYLDLEAWKRRGIFEKAGEIIAKLTSSQL